MRRARLTRAQVRADLARGESDAAAVQPALDATFDAMPPAALRARCRREGHELVTTGVEGLFEFQVCRRCGGMPYARGSR